MENKILENNFETIYKEYKEYESYLSSVEEEVQNQRVNFKQRVISSTDNDEVLVEELFNISIKPIQSSEDLRILRDRLISVYDAYKIFLDFPVEVKEEMKSIKRPLQTYRIHNGKQEEIDKEKNEAYREEAKKAHISIISALKTV